MEIDYHYVFEKDKYPKHKVKVMQKCHTRHKINQPGYNPTDTMGGKLKTKT